jgi:hypothetical protein
VIPAEVQPMVDVVARFPAVTVTAASWSDERWSVSFELDRSDDGWRSLAWWSWLANSTAAGVEHLELVPFSPAPHLNPYGLWVTLSSLYGQSAGEVVVLAASIESLAVDTFEGLR